ncbi:MAG: hypothetical protein ACYTG0_17725 [Planctomycetota bacterium]|jgi:hypothetical protein
MSKDRETHTLIYPNHVFQPEDLLNSIELDWFIGSWEDLKLTDDDLSALQIAIMCNPKGADVMPGTGGLRKLRFSPERWKTGKRGALRVCYVYFEKYGIVLLSLAFRKAELGNLSPAGKKAARKAIRRIEGHLKERFGF